MLKARFVNDDWELGEEDLVRVVEALKSGGLVVYPTETLYGLAADPYDEEAVDRLFRTKRRPRGEPVSVALPGLEEAQSLAHFSPLALNVWAAFMPGPLTLILRAMPEAPPYVLTEEGNIGLRMPRHPVALTIAREFGPITASSANVHGQPPPKTIEEARSQLADEVDLYVDAGPCPVGRGSTVVDLTGDRPIVKREGAVPREELERYGSGGPGEAAKGGQDSP